jgi:hypothetical protein
VFSDTIDTDISSLIAYIPKFLGSGYPLTKGSDGNVTATVNPRPSAKAYKLRTNDTYYGSEDYKYALIVSKSLTGGAILFRIQDIIDKYGEDVDVHITNEITDTYVYDYYYVANKKDPVDGKVPLGTPEGKKLLYVAPPSYTITANVVGSVIPSDYAIGDIISGPKFAYADPDTPLALDEGPPYVQLKHSGLPRWSIILIVLLLLLVIIIAVVGGYKYYKKKKGTSG